MVQVGEHIKRLREERGWSQPQLAVEAGVAVSAVSQIENGRRSPNVSTLDKLAGALGVSVADLFPKAQAPFPLDEAAEGPVELAPEGVAYFVPLEEGEEEDVVELRFVLLFENGEEVVRAMRPANPDEEHEMRQRIQKAGHSRE